MSRTPSHSLLAISVLLAVVACDRVPGAVRAPEPVGIPPDAELHVAAPTLSELCSIASRLVDTPIPEGDDGDEPAWAFCQKGTCALRRAKPVQKTSRHENAWVVPDAGGSLVVWGVEDREVLDLKLEAWRGAGGVPETDTFSGAVDPDIALRRWSPETERSRALVEQALHLTGPVTFRVERHEKRTDVRLELLENPGEPRFVSSLGEPRGDLPDVAGLLDDEMLVAIRVSVDPGKLWKLARRVLPATERGNLDAFVAKLKAEVSLDLESLLVEETLGHVFIVAYELEPKGATSLGDWIALRGTRDAILVPIRRRKPIRRAFDAWTQLSKGRLHVQESDSAHTEWAWIEDGELRWTAILGSDWVLFVDSDASMEHARRWMSDSPSKLSPVLAERGVDGLLRGRHRSGLYLDLAAWRPKFGASLDEIDPGVRAVTIVARPDGDREVVDAIGTYPQRAPSPGSVESGSPSSSEGGM